MSPRRGAPALAPSPTWAARARRLPPVRVGVHRADRRVGRSGRRRAVDRMARARPGPRHRHQRLRARAPTCRRVPRGARPVRIGDGHLRAEPGDVRDRRRASGDHAPRRRGCSHRARRRRSRGRARQDGRGTARRAEDLPRAGATGDRRPARSRGHASVGRARARLPPCIRRRRHRRSRDARARAVARVRARAGLFRQPSAGP